MLQPNEINELLDIISRNTHVFIASTLGHEYLTTDEIQKLKTIGIDAAKLYQPINDMVLQSFYFGLISHAIDNPKTVTFETLKEHFKKGEHLPLTQRERFTIQSIKKQYLGDIRANNGRIFTDVNHIIAAKEKSNRHAYENVLRSEIEAGLVKKKTYGEIARELGKKTGDWSRNFGRIVEYTGHYALNEGRFEAIQLQEKGTKIWFDVFDGACKYCIKLYLTNGLGSEPILFEVQELKDNGSNIGRKAEDWKATISPIHPHCRCLANHHKDGMKWDAKNKMFIFTNEYKSQVQRPKIHFTFNGKEHYV